MATVGYLLGAGASAQCIPVVNGMAKDMGILISQLQDSKTISSVTSSTSKLKIDPKYQTVIDTLKHLQDVCERYYSIDTYAKKLSLVDKNNFKKLKLELSLYFTLRQVFTNPDKRYDNFFSSILNSNNSLPSKIKLISWNYDFQLEKSYSEFNIGMDFDRLKLSLGMVSPHEHERYPTFHGKFNIIKLNGSARIETRDHKGYLVNSFESSKSEQIDEIINRFTTITAQSNFRCELKFAWENESYEKLFQAASAELNMITVLVIIGYSFPFFNREVDATLFKNLRNLSKIYVQDCNPENIIETMQEFVSPYNENGQKIDIVPKKNIEQFVFPKELDVIN